MLWVGCHMGCTLLALLLLQDLTASSLALGQEPQMVLPSNRPTLRPGADVIPTPAWIPSILCFAPPHAWGGSRPRLKLRGGHPEAMDMEERDDAPGSIAASEKGEGGISDDDDEMGQVVVPAEGTLIEALNPVLGEQDDYDRPRCASQYSALSITVTEGLHNLTRLGEVPLCRRVHLAALPGAKLAAYARPRPISSFVPIQGGGRLRFMAVSCLMLTAARCSRHMCREILRCGGQRFRQRVQARCVVTALYISFIRRCVRILSNALKP